MNKNRIQLVFMVRKHKSENMPNLIPIHMISQVFPEVGLSQYIFIGALIALLFFSSVDSANRELIDYVAEKPYCQMYMI